MASGAVARRTIIARMGKLVALNGSEVRVREREDAERFYLRAVAQEYPEGGLPKEAVIEKGKEDAATDISDGPAAAHIHTSNPPLSVSRARTRRCEAATRTAEVTDGGAGTA